MIYVFADLSEPQREVLQQTMYTRNLSFTTLAPETLTEMITVMLCAPRNALENPSFSRGAGTSQRSFLVGEYGQLDGFEGH